jgi:hypothetical protein
VPAVLSAFSFPNGLRKGGINPANGQVVPGARSGWLHARHRASLLPRDLPAATAGSRTGTRWAATPAGLVMGTVRHDRSSGLPLPASGPGHPKYAILDNFFQAGVRRLILNHQWLVAAATPVVQAQRTAAPANAAHSGARPATAFPVVTVATGVEPTRRDGALYNSPGQRPGQRRADAVVSVCRRRSPDFGLRRLLGQHADSRRSSRRPVRAEAPGADEPDDR